MRTGTDGRTAEELLQELLVYQKKGVRASRAATVVALVLVLALLAAMLMVVPRVLRLADEAERSLADVNRLAASAQELIGNANDMIAANTDAVTETIQKLNELDFDSLNATIHNLEDALSPVAELARKLGG